MANRNQTAVEFFLNCGDGWTNLVNLTFKDPSALNTALDGTVGLYSYKTSDSDEECVETPCGFTRITVADQPFILVEE